MTLGEKIQYHRKLNKLSQEKIAELIGISRQAVTKWETNQSVPSTENLIKLAAVFHVSLDELTNTQVECNDTASENEALKPEYQNPDMEYNAARPEDKNKKWYKKAPVLWGITLAVLLIIFIFTLNSWIWLLFNLVIISGLFMVGIYIITLLIRALNKYIHS